MKSSQLASYGRESYGNYLDAHTRPSTLCPSPDVAVPSA